MTWWDRFVSVMFWPSVLFWIMYAGILIGANR